MSPALRKNLLAAFVVGHALAITTQALPLPAKRLTPEVAAREPLASDLQTWARPLIALGVVAADDVPASAIALSERVCATRRAVLRPLLPYFYFTGTKQSWRMFSTVSPRAARLHIELQRAPNGPWEPLYIEHTEHQWQGRLLNQERVRTLRAAFSTRNRKRRPAYRRFVGWLANRAAAEHPDAHSLRVRYQKLHIDKPARIRAEGGLRTGEFVWEEIRLLAEHR